MTNQSDQTLAVKLSKIGTKELLEKSRITTESLNRAVTNVLQKNELYRIARKERQERQKVEEVINPHSAGHFAYFLFFIIQS